MYFQEDDLFLINRDSVSSTMEALTIKNIVNPVGAIEKPIIEKPTEQQGFPVQSSIINRNFNVYGDTTNTIKLKNLNNLELIGNEGTDLSPTEEIISTSAYTPITTAIRTVTDLGGNQYELTFDPINYDITFFNTNEPLHIEGKTTDYTLDSITSQGGMIVNSVEDFSQYIGKKLESKRSIVAKGKLKKFYIVDAGNNDYRCDIEDVEEFWISSDHNNRRQRMTFDTTLPKGGEHVDFNNALFVANEFEVDNPVLYLTDVIWRLNGVEYNVPIVDKEAKQEWDVPPEAMIEDAVNVVTVTYIAGQNRATSERTEFIPKSNPTRLGNSVNLLNKIEAFTTEVTALGL